MAIENKFTIEVQKDDEIDAWGAYVQNSVYEEKAIVLINIKANLITSIEQKISLKEMIVETLMHEVGHALEEWFDLDFNEERIESIIESYREIYSNKEN